MWIVVSSPVEDAAEQDIILYESTLSRQRRQAVSELAFGDQGSLLLEAERLLHNGFLEPP